MWEMALLLRPFLIPLQELSERLRFMMTIWCRGMVSTEFPCLLKARAAHGMTTTLLSRLAVMG